MLRTESEPTAAEAKHEAAKPPPRHSRNQGSKRQEGACDTGTSQSGENTAGLSDSAQQTECDNGLSEPQRLATCESKRNPADQGQKHASDDSDSGKVKGRRQSWAGKSSLPEEMLQTALLAGLGPRAKKRQLQRQMQAALDARDCGSMAGTGSIQRC